MADFCISEFALIRKMQALALVNSQLHTLLSFPLSIYFFIKTETLVVVPCMIIFYIAKTGPVALLFAVYPTIIWICLAYLVNMNREIVETVERIACLLRDRHQPEVEHKVSGQMRAILQRHLARHTAASNHRHLSEDNKRSCSIRLHEAHFYRSYFQLRLFHLTRVDLSFLFYSSLFAMNYVVFLNQTN